MVQNANIYLYPIPLGVAETLKPENRVIIIYTSQNIKPLHRAVGNPMNPHYGGLVSNGMLVYGKVHDPPAVKSYFEKGCRKKCARDNPESQCRM